MLLNDSAEICVVHFYSNIFKINVNAVQVSRDFNNKVYETDRFVITHLLKWNSISINSQPLEHRYYADKKPWLCIM